MQTIHESPHHDNELECHRYLLRNGTDLGPFDDTPGNLVQLVHSLVHVNIDVWGLKMY